MRKYTREAKHTIHCLIYMVAGRALVWPAYTRLHYSVVPLVRLCFSSLMVIHLLACLGS